MKVGMFVIVTLVLAVGSVSPVAQAQTGSVFRHENTPGNLQALLQTVFQKIYVEKSVREGAALFRSLVPDERRARKALKDGIAPATLQKVLDLHKTLANAGDEDVSKLARSEQTVVRVHGATTEDIRKYQEGSVAFRNFPGGAKQAAEHILRPGVTFYEVEFLEPGKTLGIKFHLFYWDGQQWSMLGPVWRAVA